MRGLAPTPMSKTTAKSQRQTRKTIKCLSDALTTGHASFSNGYHSGPTVLLMAEESAEILLELGESLFTSG